MDQVTAGTIVGNLVAACVGGSPHCYTPRLCGTPFGSIDCLLLSEVGRHGVLPTAQYVPFHPHTDPLYAEPGYGVGVSTFERIRGARVLDVFDPRGSNLHNANDLSASVA